MPLTLPTNEEWERRVMKHMDDLRVEFGISAPAPSAAEAHTAMAPPAQAKSDAELQATVDLQMDVDLGITPDTTAAAPAAATP